MAVSSSLPRPACPSGTHSCRMEPSLTPRLRGGRRGAGIQLCAPRSQPCLHPALQIRHAAAPTCAPRPVTYGQPLQGTLLAEAHIAEEPGRALARPGRERNSFQS